MESLQGDHLRLQPQLPQLLHHPLQHLLLQRQPKIQVPNLLSHHLKLQLLLQNQRQKRKRKGKERKKRRERNQRKDSVFSPDQKTRCAAVSSIEFRGTSSAQLFMLFNTFSY
jgi:hypothetical protein